MEDLSMEEHGRLVSASDRYGEYYEQAAAVTLLLSNMMMWPLIDCDLFIRFLSQMKKHHTLAIMSLGRGHRIQAKLDLRFFLESTVNAAYALVHVSTDIYWDLEAQKVKDAQAARGTANKWIATAYPDHSAMIKSMKDTINEETAHANIMASQHNFNIVRTERLEIHTTFFDFDDDEWTKTDLWHSAQAGLVAIDLLLAIQKTHGVFLPTAACDQLPALIAWGDELVARLATNDAAI